MSVVRLAASTEQPLCSHEELAAMKFEPWPIFVAFEQKPGNVEKHRDQINNIGTMSKFAIAVLGLTKDELIEKVRQIDGGGDPEVTADNFLRYMVFAREDLEELPDHRHNGRVSARVRDRQRLCGGRIEAPALAQAAVIEAASPAATKDHLRRSGGPVRSGRCVLKWMRHGRRRARSPGGGTTSSAASLEAVSLATLQQMGAADARETTSDQHLQVPSATGTTSSKGPLGERQESQKENKVAQKHPSFGHFSREHKIQCFNCRPFLRR
jgi:hypothetical protein